MQKIKDSLIKKMFKYNLSRICMVTLLDLLNIADERGQVQVYYKDLVNLINCSKAQFYNVLKELEDINIIERRKNKTYKNEIEITICENDFLQGYSNYVDTNKTFFTERIYANMKAGEIRVYLYFLFRVCKQKFDKYNEKNKLFYNGSYKKIAKQIGITNRMIKIYCKLLDDKGLICVGEKIDCKKKKYDIITVNKKDTEAPVVTVSQHGQQEVIKSAPLHLHWCHYIQNLCRRNKKLYDTENVNNTAILFRQYKRKAEEQDKDIYRVLANAVSNLDGNVLNSKIVHCIIRSLIGLDYAESIIAY